MKLWIPAVLLLSVFLGATLWQSRWTAELREHRNEAWDRAYAGPTPEEVAAARAAERRRGSDIARVVVGRPSGAAPLPRPEPRTPPLRPLEPGETRFLPREPRDGPLAEAPRVYDDTIPVARTDSEPDFTMVVRSGQSLSVICQEHYGTARPSLVKALADYNGLADVDSIRVGDSLLLPAIERLRPASGV